MKKGFLIGKKIYLRGLEEPDLEKIQEWLCDNDVTKLLFQGAIPPNIISLKEEHQQQIKNNKDIPFAIITKSTNKCIGWAGLYEIDWINRKGEIRFFVGNKSFWKKGFTTEAVSLLIDYGFNKLNLHKIYGGSNAKNIGSIKTFKKLGFKQEGISLDGHYRNGKYYDLIYFGLLNNS